MGKNEVELKTSKSALVNAIQFYLPLIEEITDAGMLPMCVIGVNLKDKENKLISAHFATHNATMDSMLYDICKSFIKAYEEGAVKTI